MDVFFYKVDVFLEKLPDAIRALLPLNQANGNEWTII